MASWPPKKNTGFSLETIIRDNTGSIVTTGTLTSTLIQDGTATAGPTPVFVSAGGGAISITLTGGQNNFDRMALIVASDAAEAKDSYRDWFNVVNQLDDIPTTAMRGTDGALTDKAGFSLAATGINLLTQTEIGVIEFAKALIDHVNNKANHNVPNSLGKQIRLAANLTQIDGSISGTPTNQAFDTNLTQPDGYWNDAVFIFANGAANAGRGITVLSYVNANGRMTFDSVDAWAVLPVSGDDFTMFANHVHPVSQIAEESRIEMDANSTKLAEITPARMSELDPANLPADIDTLLTGVVVTTNNDKTGYTVAVGGIPIGGIVAGGITDATTSTDFENAIRDAVWQKIIETQGSFTAQQTLSILLALCAGVTNTDGARFLTPDGVTQRALFSYNSTNNRLTVSLSPSS